MSTLALPPDKPTPAHTQAGAPLRLLLAARLAPAPVAHGDGVVVRSPRGEIDAALCLFTRAPRVKERLPTARRKVPPLFARASAARSAASRSAAASAARCSSRLAAAAAASATCSQQAP